MATINEWTPFGVALNITATAGSVTRVSATKFNVQLNVSWKTTWSGAKTNYGMTVISGGVTKTISSFGVSRSSGSGTFTGSYAISGNGAQTKSITVSFKNFNTDNGDSATKNITVSVSVPAWTSYTVAYNANGGTGAPSNQTKWKDQTLTLSSTKPSKDGWTFMGWGTSATDTTVDYAVGAKYVNNASMTLYAIWRKQITLTYSSGGISGVTNIPAAQSAYIYNNTASHTFTISTQKPTRTDYTFKGWGRNTSTVSYSAGKQITLSNGLTLYAIWQKAYKNPTLGKVTVSRVSGGVEGKTSCTVSCAWESFVENPKLTITIQESNVTSFSDTYTLSGKSGTFKSAEPIAVNGLDLLKSYTVYVKLSDGKTVVSKIAYIPAVTYPIHFKPGGKGTAVGKPSEIDGIFDVGWETYHRDNVDFSQNKVIKGTHPSTGKHVEAFNPINASGNTVIGYGNYSAKEGGTNIYGYDILFGVSNIATPGTFRPYRRRGDSIGFNLRTTGYVTNAKKEVTFLAPLTVPIFGSPTVTVVSNDGFKLRQNNAYTHGSSADGFTVPDTYTASYSMWCGVYITATFSNLENVINNAPIGIYWSGTITFS